MLARLALLRRLQALKPGRSFEELSRQIEMEDGLLNGVIPDPSFPPDPKPPDPKQKIPMTFERASIQQRLDDLLDEIENAPHVGSFQGSILWSSIDDVRLATAGETSDALRREAVKVLARRWTPEQLSKQALPYLRALADEGLLAGNPTLSISPENRKRIEDAFQSLQRSIRDVAGLDVTPDMHPRLRLGSLDADDARLSPGQSILLQLAVGLHARAPANDAVLLLDEPERHLHPKALLDLFRRLEEATRHDGQLWIATHSIHLLAEVKPQDIWFMKDGKVERGGRSVQAVLRGLVGSDDDIERLGQLLISPAQHAAVNFAAECSDETGRWLPSNATIRRAIRSSWRSRNSALT